MAPLHGRAGSGGDLFESVPVAVVAGVAVLLRRRKSRMASASARQSSSQLLEDRRLCIVKRSGTGREEMNRAWALFRPCWYQFGGTNGVFLRVFVALEERAH